MGEEELANEGILGLSVPSDTGTDGTRLHHMAIHGIIRDMITRRNTFFPKYGVLLSNHYAFPLTLTLTH